jgi:membrane protease YdiL (CAAX protease family)
VAEELWPTFLAFLILLTAGGLLAAALWWLRRSTAALLPHDKIILVTWTGREVVLAFLFWLLFQGTVTFAMEQVLRWLGRDVLTAEQIHLWAATVTAPFFIAALVWGLYRLTGTRPAQLGLSFSRLSADVMMGYLTWLVVTPPVLLLYLIMTLFIKPETHPLQSLVGENTAIVEWVLLIMQAVILAPLLEELLFRGLVQGWLTRATMLNHFAVALVALALTVSVAQGLVEKVREGLNDLEDVFNAENLAVLGSVAFFLFALIPGYLILANRAMHTRAPSWLPPPDDVSSPSGSDGAITVSGPSQPIPAEAIMKPPASSAMPPPEENGLSIRAGVTDAPPVNDLAAIYGSALLFAAFHAQVWPSPIPLFFLGLGLGWLAYRVQSLVAPMVVHALFNAVACIVLVLERL